MANRRNEGVGLALIMHIDFARETITLRTPVPAAQIKVVIWHAVCPGGWANSATTYRVVYLPEEAIYAFSRESSVGNRGTTRHWEGDFSFWPMAVRVPVW